MIIKFIRAIQLDNISLMHISLRKDIAGHWTPGTQDGSDTPGEHEDSTWLYPEPPMKSISLAPTVECCFTGVYPNIARFFEKDNVKYLDFAVYEPDFNGHERIILPDTLTKDKLVWDAHITNEYRVLDSVDMVKKGTVRIFNTNKSPTRKTHPFNNPKNPEESVGPLNIKFEWLK